MLKKTLKFLVLESLLIESKTDSIAKRITRQLLQKLVKSDVEKIGSKSWIALKTPELVDEPYYCKIVAMEVITMPSWAPNTIKVGGHYDGDESYLGVRLGADDPFAKHNFEKIYDELYPIIRHELEHAVQSGRVGMQYWIENVPNSSSTLEKLKNYWLAPSEVQAMTLEFYASAKQKHFTFGSVLQMRVERIYKEARAGTMNDEQIGNPVNPQDASRLAEDFRNAIIQYAKSRFETKYHKYIMASQFPALEYEADLK